MGSRTPGLRRPRGTLRGNGARPIPVLDAIDLHEKGVSWRDLTKILNARYEENWQAASVYQAVRRHDLEWAWAAEGRQSA